jgi:hypothetical protein
MIQSIRDGRQEDGNRSIADKITKRLHDLDKTVENNQGRWAWELLQNAKDSIAEDPSKTISVQIQLDENSVEFRHNGEHFTEQDVRGLINQISSKETEEGEQTKKIGRFGTGFLTTHLLSKVVKIQGVVKAQNKNFYTFEFLLDRQGNTTKQLIPKIENSWKEFDNSVKKIDFYNKNQFNTSFSYHLETEEQKRIARIGIEEFSNLLPFVLTFIPKISKVEIIDNIAGRTTIFEREKSLVEDLILPISKTENGHKTNIFILYTSDDKVTIATEVEKNDRGYSIKSIENTPKLFCDFPLIGTEKFWFPVVINSFFFNPQTERDGIWLKGNDVEVDENKQLLVNAFKLYKDLVSKIVERDFFDLYNLVETETPSTQEKNLDKGWYVDFIQEPMREFIDSTKIVELEVENSEKKAIKDLFFPNNNFVKSVKYKMWQFAFDLRPSSVCKKAHLEFWCDKSWESWKKIDYQALAKAINKRQNIQNLSYDLGKDKDVFVWLNSFISFVLEDDSNLALFNKVAIIPNKNEVFKEKGALNIDDIRDEELIDILKLLGEDWRDILIHDSISFDNCVAKDKKDIAFKITEKLVKRSHGFYQDISKAIYHLSEWFDSHEQQGRDLFPELYNDRAKLVLDTIQDKDSLYKVLQNFKDKDLAKLADKPNILESIQKAEDLDKLLEEFNVSNLSDLKDILVTSQNNLLHKSRIQITQETLLSLGITSVEELEKALKDKSFSDQFVHESTSTAQMFLYVQSLIKRSIKNVIEYLNTLPNYDCNESEELAPTVIGGIKKDGVSIYVVVRPSDKGEVIFHYGSEKDALDDPNAELWVDNGKDKPKNLTLGRILKTTGINRIPIT